MPHANRMTPFGTLEATTARGTLMGNRGILHDEAGRIGPALYRHKSWIACLTAFRGRRRRLLAPGSYTELFFLDEVTAFAAGHRPCAECRRADYRRFLAAWGRAHPHMKPPRARAVDEVLHASRIDPATRRQRRAPARLDTLPDGAFVVREEAPHEPLLWWQGALLPWSHAGYGPARTLPCATQVHALTPRPVLATLEAGYRPDVHASAFEALRGAQPGTQTVESPARA